MRPKNDIAITVSRERKRLGYTQDEFSQRVGVSLSFLRKLEQGKETLRMDKVKEVLEFLGFRLTTARGGNED